MDNEFRLLNANGGIVNTFPTLAKAKRIQAYYEGSKVQQLVNQEWVDVD